MEDLTNLVTLNLSKCGLTVDPQALCKLKLLKRLEIDGNTIESFPELFMNLTNLETLNLSNCDLRNHIDTSKDAGMFCSPFLYFRELNLSACCLTKLPSFVFELTWLKKLDISTNPIARIPKVIRRCKYLEKLNISHCEIKEFPTVIYNMNNLLTVIAMNISLEVLDEDFVKLWSQKPEIFTKGKFQKVTGVLLFNFIKPPNEIVQRGPEACMKYYKALRVSHAVNCSILNVAVMGKTGAGKSSLVHSIKEGASVLMNPSDRTVVVDTLEVMDKSLLLKIADFGGHDIYEITCPLFLKSTKQAAVVAVKLQEYSGKNHDKLVTKWLKTVVSHMISGSICVVATQCDLCTESELQEKMEMLKEKVTNWIKDELSFWKKIRSHHPSTTEARRSIFVDLKFYYFQTSSLNMEGVTNLKKFLFKEANSNISVLPQQWTDVYKKIDEQNDKGTHFITETQFRTLFVETTRFPDSDDPFQGLKYMLKRLSLQSSKRPSVVKESLQCLKFLHDSGMILWYGEKHENLRNIIFHDPSFPVSVLQSLFRHDLIDILKYDHEQFGRHFISRSKFEAEVRRFVQNGILNPVLLRCIWKKFEFTLEVFDTMVDILTMLDLCYRDEQSSELRLPWFVQNGDMDFLEDLWPETLPPNILQYTFTYCFCHRIPGVIFERFCVRLQRHLQTGAYTRQDCKDAVYIEQNKVQIFFQRHPNESEPNMQIHMRSPIQNFLQLQKLCLVLHQDMDKLSSEYSGLYIDSYLLCPHCLLTQSMTPIKRPLSDLDAKDSLDWVPCDPSTPGSVQIPAALVFLTLCGKSLASLKKMYLV